MKAAKYFTAPVCLIAFVLTLSLTHSSVRADDGHHERIDKARQALTAAYDELDHAGDDFGGHKAEAMKKISEANDSLEKWHDHPREASKKLDDALEQLHICKDKGHGRHEKIDQAIDALEAAKDELH